MSRTSKEDRFPDDLQEVADVLHDRRPTLDPLALDRVKLRAMSGARRSSSSLDRGFFMRSRLTTLLVAAFLTLGTGGAIALAGGGFDGGGGSASFSQYKECGHEKNCKGGGKEKDKGGGKDHEGGGDKGGGGKGGGDKGGGDKGGGGKGHGHH